PHFAFETYDTYSWYLELGPLSNINAKYLHGSIPYWNDVVAHPDYDEFWKKEAWVSQLHASTVPNLNVAGFWDQEDPWGPWQIFRHAAEHDPDHTNLMVAGPWYHGQWRAPKADSIGLIALGGHETAREYRETVEAPFFRYYLHGRGEKPAWRATTFQSGANRGRTYAEWPPKEAQPTNLYLHADGTLSFERPRAGGKAYREYVSDPANPVPYRPRPISPTYPGGDWRTWEVQDQRFVEGRPDVLTFATTPLDHDLTITVEVSADRSQSSEIRAQHLSGDGGGFRHGDPARLLLPGAGVTPGAARGAVTRTAQRSALRRPIFSSASVGAGPPTATMTRFRPPVFAW